MASLQERRRWWPRCREKLQCSESAVTLLEQQQEEPISTAGNPTAGRNL